MDDASSAGTAGSDFEFAALREARNYRQALARAFQPFLQGRVLEVGAGIGQMTDELMRLPHVQQLVSIEPDPAFCEKFRKTHPQQSLIAGTIANAPGSERWNGIVSVNVLEHIEQDAEELAQYRKLLRPAQGALCLFVPARPEIYAPIDRAFGHYRRYTRRELSDKAGQAGFEIVRLRYFNLVGYFAWWLMFRMLKKAQFDPVSVRWFDRVIFPPMHWLEANVMPPPIGQSLLLIARVKKDF